LPIGQTTLWVYFYDLGQRMEAVPTGQSHLSEEREAFQP
jgi:hypothetical protein